MILLRLYFLLLLLCFSHHVKTQDISIGEWRIHASYNNIKSVSAGTNTIYAASPNGVMVFDKNDKSSATYTKLNLLTNAGINFARFNQSTDQLFVVYDNGTFDVVKNNASKNFDPSENTVLTGPTNIYDVRFLNNLAYLATDYGVLVFDLPRSELKETWRDLGLNGATLKIFASAFHNDSVFLATERGVLAGDPDDNLLDFNKWKRMTSGDLNTPVSGIQSFNGKLYVTIDQMGIYSYENYTWVKEAFLSGKTFNSFNASTSGLLVTEAENLWFIDTNETVTAVSTPLATMPNEAQADAAGKIWIGDSANGLITDAFGAFEAILPNGPATDAAYRLHYHDNRMYVVPGGHTGEAPTENPGVVSYFENGRWSSLDESVKDLTGITFDAGGGMYLSSFGHGVVFRTESSTVLYNEENSTLVNVNPPGRNVKISSVFYSTDGLWASNYGTFQSLHLLDADGQWQSYNFPFAQSNFPMELLVDFERNVWMRIDPTRGGGLVVFNKANNESRLMTDADGGGELPSKSVYSMAIDRDGYVWAGTDAGVAYFYDEQSDAVKPLFEDRFLLKDETVMAIAVDGGNRKWMGTQRGAWLFNSTGELLVRNFTAENSPLISDRIFDIEIDPRSGEVFFATDKGVVSFRGDATVSSDSFDKIKIFPNPVVATFNGEVGITGLATDAVVKITDVSGRLLYETVANGGTASWDVRDHQGRRVPTGVFLVFAVKSDGSESMVGKIAVVN